MPDTFHWKLANPEAALKLISNDPLEKSSIDAKPIGLEPADGRSPSTTMPGGLPEMR